MVGIVTVSYDFANGTVGQSISSSGLIPSQLVPNYTTLIYDTVRNGDTNIVAYNPVSSSAAGTVSLNPVDKETGPLTVSDDDFCYTLWYYTYQGFYPTWDAFVAVLNTLGYTFTSFRTASANQVTVSSSNGNYPVSFANKAKISFQPIATANLVESNPNIALTNYTDPVAGYSAIGVGWNALGNSSYPAGVWTYRGTFGANPGSGCDYLAYLGDGSSPLNTTFDYTMTPNKVTIFGVDYVFATPATSLNSSWTINNLSQSASGSPATFTGYVDDITAKYYSAWDGWKSLTPPPPEIAPIMSSARFSRAFQF